MLISQMTFMCSIWTGQASERYDFVIPDEDLHLILCWNIASCTHSRIYKDHFNESVK